MQTHKPQSLNTLACFETLEGFNVVRLTWDAAWDIMSNHQVAMPVVLQVIPKSPDAFQQSLILMYLEMCQGSFFISPSVTRSASLLFLWIPCPVVWFSLAIAGCRPMVSRERTMNLIWRVQTPNALDPKIPNMGLVLASKEGVPTETRSVPLAKDSSFPQLLRNG